MTTPTLTKDSPPELVRAVWADRLEANPERQGKGKLAPRPDKRCCFGDLCDMAVDAGVIAFYIALDTHPPLAVTRWAGIAGVEGSYEIGCVFRSLVNDNDGRHTWPQIAATIRAEPEGLVVQS